MLEPRCNFCGNNTDSHEYGEASPVAALHRDLKQELRNIGGRLSSMREDPIRFGSEIRKFEERIEDLHKTIERSGGSSYSN